jgi:hypothetical protein
VIETVSHPADLKTWKAQEQPFYLELVGETSPLVDTQYAEVSPAGPLDAAPQISQAAPIYEYWWTIGHPGQPHRTGHLWDASDGDEPAGDMWQKLQEQEGAAGRVYLFFPTSGGWRIKELLATVKYLPPHAEQHTLWEQVSQGWKAASPIVSDAAELAKLVPAGAAIGVALSVIAKLQVNSVPQAEGFEWSVSKVTFGSIDGVMQGVMWELPPKMFTDLGSRLTGSLALSFIPAHNQQNGNVSTGPIELKPLPALAHAVVYGPEGPIWVPGRRQFVKLTLAPVVPSSGR